MRTSAICWAILYTVSVAAQNVVTHKHNIPCPGDEVVKEQVEFVNCGNSGDNVFWNYCDIPIQKSDYRIYYSGDSILTEITPDAIYRYTHNDNGLQFIEYENPLVIMNYDTPIIKMIYPIVYGNTAQSAFSGIGKYSGIYNMTHNGLIIHEADATGTMSLVEGDTLKNVLRIHSIRTSAVHLYTDTLYVDSFKNIKQEIEEQYTWYARGYRYPVFETLSRTTYNDMRPVSVYQTAFRCLPEEQRKLPDPLNEDIAKNDSVLENGFLPRKSTKMTSRSVTVHGSAVAISYDMEADAHVTFIIAGTTGMLYRKKEMDCIQGTGYSTVIDCSGLRSGEYILYINVSGNIENEIIIL